MADFDLTQTDAQVQSILNDGQNMQGAGAQTTLTTESVLLKDVNGNYHKILKSSFTEAIRDTLAGLLVNNDKGTTINQIAAIASGDFGSITPANLASVLGGTTHHELNGDSTIDLNDFTTDGIYKSGYAFNNYVNAPSDAIYGIMTVSMSDAYISQTIFDGYGKVFNRIYTGTWSSWQRLDNFGCNTPADLASLLGADMFNVRLQGGTTVSCDLYIENSGYAYLQDANAVNIAKFPVDLLTT